MARYYTTKRDGEMLDLICKLEYGEETPAIDQVLAANPDMHILSRTPLLPAGVTFLLPDIEQPSSKLQKLYD